jgi:hypothetical protein
MAVKKGTGKRGTGKRPAGGMQAPYITKGAKSKARAKPFSPRTLGPRSSVASYLEYSLPKISGKGGQTRSLLVMAAKLLKHMKMIDQKSQTSKRPAGGMQAPYIKRNTSTKSKKKGRK